MQAEVGDPTTIISNGDELARFSRWSSAGPRQEKRGMHTPKSGNPPDHANGAMSARGELPARLASGRYLQPDELALNQRVQLRACHVQLVGRMLHEQQCRNFMGGSTWSFPSGHTGGGAPAPCSATCAARAERLAWVGPLCKQRTAARSTARRIPVMSRLRLLR
jgi:hypothetical protein